MTRVSESHSVEPPPQERTRLAPSPTGAMHLGHVIHGLSVLAAARQRGAEVIIRLEDHDTTRCRPEYVAAWTDDLAWLGWDARGLWRQLGVHASWAPRQTERHAVYEARAIQAHDATYFCTCSRQAIRTRVGTSEGYDGYCRNAGHSAGALRLALEGGGKLRDPIIRGADGRWSYTWCVVNDDADQGIHLVVRGRDLEHMTPMQQAIAKHLEVSAPAFYLHHDLLCAPDGRKLSKRDGDETIAHLRAQGCRREAVFAEALRAMKWLPTADPSPTSTIALSNAVACAARFLPAPRTPSASI